jgi:DNA-binding SARP family transcriptional activator
MDQRETLPVEPITLSLRLLGRVAAAVNGRELRVTGRHAQALLALLVLQPRPRAREAIAADLWPESDLSSASSLRQALWLLRSGLAGAGIEPDAVIQADPESIGLQACLRVELDAIHFERLVRGRPAEPEAALDLYRGDLAEGLGHECFAADRERLCDAYEDALALAASSRFAAGDVDGARAAALELLARDALREEAHEILIRVYGSVGSRGQVLRQYRRLTATLAREIGVEPLPETVAAFRLALLKTAERSRRQAASEVFGTGVRVAAYAAPS